jgi:dienelactone hydrolase
MMNEEEGWVGFAADIYGPDLQDYDNFTINREQATLYRSNEELFMGRIQAAIDVLIAHPMVISDQIAIIGCKWCAF